MGRALRARNRWAHRTNETEPEAVSDLVRAFKEDDERSTEDWGGFGS